MAVEERADIISEITRISRIAVKYYNFHNFSYGT